MSRARHVKCGKGAYRHITPKILLVNTKLQTWKRSEIIPDQCNKIQ